MFGAAAAMQAMVDAALPEIQAALANKADKQTGEQAVKEKEQEDKVEKIMTQMLQDSFADSQRAFKTLSKKVEEKVDRKEMEAAAEAQVLAVASDLGVGGEVAENPELPELASKPGIDDMDFTHPKVIAAMFQRQKGQMEAQSEVLKHMMKMIKDKAFQATVTALQAEGSVPGTPDVSNLQFRFEAKADQAELDKAISKFDAEIHYLKNQVTNKAFPLAPEEDADGATGSKMMSNDVVNTLVQMQEEVSKFQ
eukprot:gene32647-41517_t